MHLGRIGLAQQRRHLGDQRLALWRGQPGLQLIDVGEAHQGGEGGALLGRRDDIHAQGTAGRTGGGYRTLQPALIGVLLAGQGLVADHQGDDTTVRLV